MGFLAPLVLLGLGALAIPVLMHLIQREKKRVVEFPSLMFLRRIPYQSVRRRRIRDWPLLLMRLAALALDRGWRSRGRSSGGRRLPPRRRTARAKWSSWSTPPTAWGTAIAGRERRRPRAARSTRSRPATAARWCCSPPAPSSRSARPPIAAGCSPRSTTAAVGPGATRFAPALKLGGSILGESPLPSRESRF